MAQIEGLIGPDSARALQDIRKNAQSPTSGTVATIIGIISLILGASGVFGDLQAALNTVWEVKPKPNRALIGLVKDRFLSLTMVLGTGFLLLVIMDLALPDGDALDVIRRIKAEDDDIVVVAFSGWQHLESAALAAGADAFVLKPDLDALERLLAYRRGPAAERRAGAAKKTG